MGECLQKKSVFAIIILSIVTLGVYVPVWFLKQRNALNNLNSEKKINWDPYILLIFSIISIILIVPTIIIGGWVNIISDIINWAIAINIILLSFSVRRILKEHYNIDISGLATFFLSIWYLQYKINKLPEAPVNNLSANTVTPTPKTEII